MGYKMPFGKYRGRELSSLPRDYLEWLGEEERELREPLKTNVARLLDGDYDAEEEEVPAPRRSPYKASQPPAPRQEAPAVIKVDLGARVEAVGTDSAVTAQAMASISRALWAILAEVRGIRHGAAHADEGGIDETSAPAEGAQ